MKYVVVVRFELYEVSELLLVALLVAKEVVVRFDKTIKWLEIGIAMPKYNVTYKICSSRNENF